jgi:hypothetical protein
MTMKISPKNSLPLNLILLSTVGALQLSGTINKLVAQHLNPDNTLPTPLLHVVQQELLKKGITEHSAEIDQAVERFWLATLEDPISAEVAKAEKLKDLQAKHGNFASEGLLALVAELSLSAELRRETARRVREKWQAMLENVETHFLTIQESRRNNLISIHGNKVTDEILTYCGFVVDRVNGDQISADEALAELDELFLGPTEAATIQAIEIEKPEHGGNLNGSISFPTEIPVVGEEK